MKILNLSRCVFNVCIAAVLLAGCGGSLSPIAAPGAMPQSAVHASGKFFLYVADQGLNAVAILNSRYRLVRSITQGVNVPAGEWFDKHGNLYVANMGGSLTSCSGGNVVEYPPGADAPRFTYSAGLKCPTTVATDPLGHVYVYDAGYFINVYKHGQNNVVRQLRMPKPPPYTFYSWGSGLIADDKGNVFMTITANFSHRGQPGCYSGLFEYVRGKGRPHHLNDGSGCTSPGLALDSSANLIMTNTGSNCDPVPCIGDIVVYPPPYTGSSTYFGHGSGPCCVPFNLALSPDQTMLFVTNYPPYPSQPPNVLVYSYPAGQLLTTLGTGNGLSEPYGLAVSKRR